MDRREFIQFLHATGACITLTPMLMSCAGVYRKSLYEITKGVEMNNLPEELVQILGYAALSPSGHNTQPWIVKAQSQSELIIQSDKTRWLPEVDSTNREGFLSLSAFAETLLIASSAIGFDVELNLIAKDLKETDVFQVNLKKSSPTQERYLELIKNRATTRTNFDKKEIKSNELKEILNLAPNNIFYFPLGSSEGKWIANSMPEAIKQQTFNDKKQKELANWLRFSKSEAKEHGDGITSEALGMNWMAKFVWYNFFNRKTAMGESFRKKGIDIARDQVKNCSGFLILNSADNSPNSLLECGRLYQKVGLKLTELNIVHHTMSQLLEESPWSSDIQSDLKIDHTIQFVIRLGYGNKAKSSIRRSLDSIIIS